MHKLCKTVTYCWRIRSCISRTCVDACQASAHIPRTIAAVATIINNMTLSFALGAPQPQWRPQCPLLFHTHLSRSDEDEADVCRHDAFGAGITADEQESGAAVGYAQAHEVSLVRDHGLHGDVQHFTERLIHVLKP